MEQLVPDGVVPAVAAAPAGPRLVASGLPAAGGRIKASPLAKKVAAQSGVDLSRLQGSGPGGRIVRADVEAALTAAPAATARPAAAAVPPAASAPARAPFVIPPRTEAEYEDVPLTPMRATIAKRMPMSKAPVPHFYVTAEVGMDRAWELRAELARPRPLGEVPRLQGDLHQRLDVAVAQHRSDEAALERHREPDMRAMILANGCALE